MNKESEGCGVWWGGGSTFSFAKTSRTSPFEQKREGKTHYLLFGSKTSIVLWLNGSGFCSNFFKRLAS